MRTAPSVNPFRITFHPCRVPVIHGAGGKVLYCEPIEPARITVSAPIYLLGRKVIESSSRFFEFDESDEWAIASGLARLKLVPFMPGDSARLSDFCDFPKELRLRCCVGQSIEPSDEDLIFSSAEFTISENAELLVAFMQDEERRRSEFIRREVGSLLQAAR